MEESSAVFSVFGIDISSQILTTWGIMLALIVFSVIASRNLKEVPGKFQALVEVGLGSLRGMFEGIMGKKTARVCMPFLCTLFIFIIVSNYVGLLPGAGSLTGFAAPTSSLSVDAALGAVTLIAIQVYGVKVHKLGYFKRFIQPFALMLPLLVLDEAIKPVSLALRLYGNIYGEETVTHEIFQLCPLIAPVIMQVLSLLFCFLQALVFTMLTGIYMSEALGEEE